MNIPTYIINLKNREDRKKHILNEFTGREEFTVNIVEACEHQVGAIGLWNSIKHILRYLADDKDEFILLCEDDHQFTEDYSKELLFYNIVEAQDKNADILLGGVSWFNDTLQVGDNLFWVQKFSGLQFSVIFKVFFKSILEVDFENNDVADYKISSLTENKFLIHPYISTQKEFGYSDVTEKNNLEGRVNESFSMSSACIQNLKNASLFYSAINEKIDSANDLYIRENITIPTFVINLPERDDRKIHIERQFAGRNEFDVTIIEPCKHEIAAVSLWLSIRKIITMAIENDDDVILICEDDHEFTSSYSKEVLIRNIVEAHEQGADYISGGAGDFGYAVPLTKYRYWINPCYSTQFIIVYRKFFKKILDELFDNNVMADVILSQMTSNKMVLYPYISTQRDFGYSDVTPSHNAIKGLVRTLFTQASTRLEIIRTAYLKYSARGDDGVIF